MVSQDFRSKNGPNSANPGAESVERASSHGEQPAPVPGGTQPPRFRAAHGDEADQLRRQIVGCRICAARFAATATGHKPRPVVWFRPSARILIAGQAPGARVHESGRPFTDPSGDRLRAWLGLDEATFYDQSRLAIVPMAFCFPGYDARGSDLPPPKVCADTWRNSVTDALPSLRLTIAVGAYAQRWHLNTRASVTETVRGWRQHAPAVFPLPHPSWRNTGWLKKNPWFEADLLPVLRDQVQKVLNDRTG